MRVHSLFINIIAKDDLKGRTLGQDDSRKVMKDYTPIKPPM